jgi:16S rRNA (guanine527-N7)-methyltransferase
LAVPTASLTSLCSFLDAVAEWGRRTNLTGATDHFRRVEILIKPALEAVEWIEGPDMIDVGSGNGSPGLVLALLRPELSVRLLEPRLKRWAFLRDVLRRLGREDVAVERVRHDAYTGRLAQTVTVRALRLSLGEIGRLVRPGGRVVTIGKAPRPEAGFEVEGAPKSRRVHVFRCSGRAPRST